MPYPLTLLNPGMTAADLAAENPTLVQFQLAYEKDTGKMKLGPGVYNDLGYLNPSGASTVPVKATGAEVNTGTDDAKFVTAKAIEDSDYAKTAAITSAVNAAVSALLDGAPGALDTLNELAAALADDAAFSTTVTNALALRPTNAAAENAIPKSDDEGNLVASSITEVGLAVTIGNSNDLDSSITMYPGSNAFTQIFEDIGGTALLTKLLNDVLVFEIQGNGHIGWYEPGGTETLIIERTGANELTVRAPTLKFDSTAINVGALPTANPNVANQLWNDSGTVKISAG